MASRGRETRSIGSSSHACSRRGCDRRRRAPRHTLVRRFTFDLTGLPPADDLEVWLRSSADDVYDRLIDRLLCSPHYGERMAMFWLDAARYSDTDGFQGDETRTNWPWRDWVVGAFNHNLPFDQFTIQQFAGDLLPDCTPEQQLATCFHRNHMTNGEGGRDPEESRTDYVLDRVNTMGTLWLGLTLGCCQCHSHKFDPISQTDYYQLTAFFNSIAEDGLAARREAVSRVLLPECRAFDSGGAAIGRLAPGRRDAGRTEADPLFKTWVMARFDEVRGGFQAWHRSCRRNWKVPKGRCSRWSRRASSRAAAPIHCRMITGSAVPSCCPVLRPAIGSSAPWHKY